MVSGPRKTWKPRSVDIDNIDYVRVEQMDYVRNVDPKYKLNWALHVSEIGGCITKVQHRHGESPRLPPHKVSWEGSEMHRLYKNVDFSSLISTLARLDAGLYNDGKPKVNWTAAQKYVADDTVFSYNDPDMGIAIVGSPDYVLRIPDGDIYVFIDWKTGSRYLEKHIQQLRRYAMLLSYNLRKPIDCYLVVVYAPVVDLPSDASPKLIDAGGYRAESWRALPPATIGDVIMDNDWYYHILNALIFSRLHQPSLSFECGFCPYIHVCRGYPFGVAPNPEQAQEIRKSAESGGNQNAN